LLVIFLIIIKKKKKHCLITKIIIKQGVTLNMYIKIMDNINKNNKKYYLILNEPNYLIFNILKGVIENDYTVKIVFICFVVLSFLFFFCI